MSTISIIWHDIWGNVFRHLSQADAYHEMVREGSISKAVHACCTHCSNQHTSDVVPTETLILLRHDIHRVAKGAHLLQTCNMRLHASGESFEVEGWVIHGAECCPADMVTKAWSQSRQASPFHSLGYWVCPAAGASIAWYIGGFL